MFTSSLVHPDHSLCDVAENAVVAQAWPSQVEIDSARYYVSPGLDAQRQRHRCKGCNQAGWTIKSSQCKSVHNRVSTSHTTPGVVPHVRCEEGYGISFGGQRRQLGAHTGMNGKGRTDVSRGAAAIKRLKCAPSAVEAHRARACLPPSELLACLSRLDKRKGAGPSGGGGHRVIDAVCLAVGPEGSACFALRCCANSPCVLTSLSLTTHRQETVTELGFYKRGRGPGYKES